MGKGESSPPPTCPPKLGDGGSFCERGRKNRLRHSSPRVERRLERGESIFVRGAANVGPVFAAIMRGAAELPAYSADVVRLFIRRVFDARGTKSADYSTKLHGAMAMLLSKPMVPGVVKAAYQM